MSKPGTPVKSVRRLSKCGSSVAEEIPVSASMEVLTPAPRTSSALLSSKDKTRPRTPVGSTPPSPSSRKAKSAEGRKSTELKTSISLENKRLDLQAVQQRAMELNEAAYKAFAIATSPVTTPKASSSQEVTQQQLTHSSLKPLGQPSRPSSVVSEGGRTNPARYTAEPPDTPASVVSVASGKLSQDGFFLTNLRKGGFSYEGEGGLTTPVAQLQEGDVMSLFSSVNPMQSPTASTYDSGDEYASTSDDSDLDVDDMQLKASLAMTDYTNPIMTPLSTSQVLDEAPVSNAAFLTLVDQLYSEASGTASETPASRPTTAGGEAQTVEASVASDEDEDDGASYRSVRSSTTGQLEEQEQQQESRRAELQQYLSELQERTDETGEKVVQLGNREYLIELERMIRSKRNEYSSLQGWLGPRRFEELPMNQLQMVTHEDPQIMEGLERIKRLDQQLQDKTIEAMITERETNPEKWKEREKKRLEFHAKAVENILKKERKKRTKKKRLTRAVRLLSTIEEAVQDGEVEGDGEGAQNAAARQVYSRFLVLSPEEEKLVDAVLDRPEEIESNPFEGDLVVEEDGYARSLADIDAQLEEFASEHVYDEHGSIVDTLSVYADEPGAPSSVKGGPKSFQPPASLLSSSTSSTMVAGRHDYLREQREAKELNQREWELDSQLRALRGSELPARLAPDQLAALIAQCKAFQQARSNSSVPPSPSPSNDPSAMAVAPPHRPQSSVATSAAAPQEAINSTPSSTGRASSASHARASGSSSDPQVAAPGGSSPPSSRASSARADSSSRQSPTTPTSKTKPVLTSARLSRTSNSSIPSSPSSTTTSSSVVVVRKVSAGRRSNRETEVDPRQPTSIVS